MSLIAAAAAVIISLSGGYDTASGADGRLLVSDPVFVYALAFTPVNSSTKTAISTAVCPEDMEVIGGSWQIEPAGTSGPDRFEKVNFVYGIPVDSSDPDTPVEAGNAWTVRGYSSNTGSSYRFRAIAVCAVVAAAEAAPGNGDSAPAPLSPLSATVTTGVLRNASSTGQMYGDLSTASVGPTVTIDTTPAGANAMALVYVTSQMSFAGDDGVIGRMSFEVTGPDGFTTLAPLDSRSLAGNAKAASSGVPVVRESAVALVTLGPAGSYTFTAKYRTQFSSNDTGKSVTFSNRDIVVNIWPAP